MDICDCVMKHKGASWATCDPEVALQRRDDAKSGLLAGGGRYD